MEQERKIAMYYLWQPFCSLTGNKTVHNKQKKFDKSQFCLDIVEKLRGSAVFAGAQQDSVYCGNYVLNETVGE